jgi:protein-S-isoprenylcysteine O-methyltransferase Ste14
MQVLGITLIISGALLHAWSSIHLARAIKSRELIQTGPYGYIRHPMYIFIYTILIGVGMLWFSYTWFIILLLFIPIWYWTGRKEEEQMTEITDGEYQGYIKRTGMFFPRSR